jgi:hypothetical protein
MTDKLNDFRLVMKGSNDLRPRCIALMGSSDKKITTPSIPREPLSAAIFPPYGKTAYLMNAATGQDWPGVYLQ